MWCTARPAPPPATGAAARPRAAAAPLALAAPEPSRRSATAARLCLLLLMTDDDALHLLCPRRRVPAAMYHRCRSKAAGAEAAGPPMTEDQWLDHTRRHTSASLLQGQQALEKRHYQVSAAQKSGGAAPMVGR